MLHINVARNFKHTNYLQVVEELLEVLVDSCVDVDKEVNWGNLVVLTLVEVCGSIVLVVVSSVGSGEDVKLAVDSIVVEMLLTVDSKVCVELAADPEVIFDADVHGGSLVVPAELDFTGSILSSICRDVVDDLVLVVEDSSGLVIPSEMVAFKVVSGSRDVEELKELNSLLVVIT